MMRVRRHGDRLYRREGFWVVGDDGIVSGWESLLVSWAVCSSHGADETDVWTCWHVQVMGLRRPFATSAHFNIASKRYCIKT